ncbi:MAG: hypothetical protein ACLP22_01555 [Solirubrobacteraceae bacterium]
MIIDEFRANEGRVGGMWEGTPLLLLHHTVIPLIILQPQPSNRTGVTGL